MTLSKRMPFATLATCLLLQTVFAGKAHAQADVFDRVQHGHADAPPVPPLPKVKLPFNLAVVHLGLGDRTLAIDYLERAYASDSQWMGWLKKDRMFDPLRSEARFVALLKKLRLA